MSLMKGLLNGVELFRLCLGQIDREIAQERRLGAPPLIPIEDGCRPKLETGNFSASAA